MAEPMSPELSRETIIALDFSKLSFREAVVKTNTLRYLVESLPDGERKTKASSSLTIAEGRRDKLIREVSRSGGLNSVNQSLDAVEARVKSSRYSPEDFAQDVARADSFDEKSGFSITDEHYGVPSYAYRRGLDRVTARVRKGWADAAHAEAASAPEQAEQSTSPDFSTLMPEVRDSLLEMARLLQVQGRQTSELIAAQMDQMESMRVAGYSGLVSAEAAQAGLNLELFDTQPPAWYDRLPNEWKNIIRTRLGILLGAYVKREEGYLSLDPILEFKRTRINKDALVAMWNYMPGFTIATATIFHDFFEIGQDVVGWKKDNEGNELRDERGKMKPLDDKPGENILVVSEDGYKILNGYEEGGELIKGKTFSVYKNELIEKLTAYFKANPELLDISHTHNGPKSDAKLAALAAVSAAWNWIFVGNAFDSGDVGRGIIPATNSDVYVEQFRALCRPRDRGNSKWKAEKEAGKEEDILGTDETWGGPLGEYMAERIRHNEDFRKRFRAGQIKLMPKRLFYSWFDLTTFKDKASFGEKLVNGGKKVISVNGDKLYDYEGGAVDFSQLEGIELWPNYADLLDSAGRVIYKVIQTKGKEVGPNEVANALSKLRGSKFEPLKRIYSDLEVINSLVVGLCGGPMKYCSDKDMLVNISPSSYDTLITRILSEDRLFATIKDSKKCRDLIFERLNAVNTTRGVWAEDKIAKLDDLGPFLDGHILAGSRARLRWSINREVKRRNK